MKMEVFITFLILVYIRSKLIIQTIFLLNLILIFKNMTDYFSKYRNSIHTDLEIEYAERILNELSEQMYIELKDKNIHTYVANSQMLGDGLMNISLNLFSGSQKNQFFYRLIEIEQPIDKAYDVNIRAFQNPPTDWKIIHSPKELKEELIEILGDKRFVIIIEMISQMGKTIKSWDNEE